jgi:glycine betaine/proline transport system substrate-binding protein
VVGAAAWIKNDTPVLADYFSKVGLTNAQISELLVFGDENKVDAQATALNFLKTKSDVWKKWVPADVAEKVEASLD